MDTGVKIECQNFATKLVFKRKEASDENSNKCEKDKARMGTRGFEQVHGVHCDETFAPAVKFTLLCLFHAIVAVEDLKLH